MRKVANNCGCNDAHQADREAEEGHPNPSEIKWPSVVAYEGEQGHEGTAVYQDQPAQRRMREVLEFGTTAGGGEGDAKRVARIA
mgnify:CR=1 FL=1